MLRPFGLLLAISAVCGAESPEVGSACNNDTECNAVEYASCTDKQCTCRTGFAPDPGFGNKKCMSDQNVCSKEKCQRYGDKIGDCDDGGVKCKCDESRFTSRPNGCSRVVGLTCSNNDDCSLKYNETFCNDNLEKVCACVEGSWAVEMNCVKSPLACTKEKCQEDGDQQGKCFNDRTCACGDGYRPNSSKDKQPTCERVLGSSCPDGVTCDSQLPHSECDIDKCQCNPWYKSKDNLTCIHDCDPARCTQDGDASAKCEEDFCSCSKGFQHKKFMDTCLPVLGSSCPPYDTCESLVNNSNCVPHTWKCLCNDGFKKDKFACQPVLGSSCSNDDSSECADKVNNSRCTNNICECQEFYDKTNDSLTCTHYCDATRCRNDGDVNATCESGWCSCSKEFLYDKDKDTCHPVIGASCSADADCGSDVANVECVEKKCKCRANFNKTDDLRCTPDCSYLVHQCQLKDDKKATCGLDGCTCSQGFLSEKNFLCNPVIGQECSVDTSICTKNVADSECRNGTKNDVAKCFCKKGYFAVEGICKKTLGMECANSTICTGKLANSRCLAEKVNGTKYCECAEGYKESDGECVRVLKSDCTEKKSCSDYLQYSDCGQEGNLTKCRCKKGSFQSGDKCVKVLGSECTANKNCLAANLSDSICVRIDNSTSRCKCISGFSDYDDQCFKVLNKACPTDGECSDYVNNTNCFESSTCQCSKGYFQEDGACVAVLNSACNTTSDCLHGESVHGDMVGVDCQKELCKCQQGYWNIEAECSKVHAVPYVAIKVPESVTEENMGNSHLLWISIVTLMLVGFW